MRRGCAWTSDEEQRAASMWRDGVAQAAIAKALGRSVGSVSGKLHGGANSRGYARPPLVAKRETPARPPPTPRAIRERRTVHQERYRMEKPEPIPSLNIPFTDREAGQCHAVTDATRYAQRVCGHPVDERGIYCEAHQKLFYVRSPSKHR